MILVNYGTIKVNINKILEKKKMTMYGLSHKTGIKYDTIKNYCNATCSQFSLESLAKICYVLKCNISEILEYIPPSKM